MAIDENWEEFQRWFEGHQNDPDELRDLLDSVRLDFNFRFEPTHEWVKHIDEFPPVLLIIVNRWFHWFFEIQQSMKSYSDTLPVSQWWSGDGTLEIEKISYLIMLWCDTRSPVDPTALSNYLGEIERLWSLRDRKNTMSLSQFERFEESSDAARRLMLRLSNVTFLKMEKAKLRPPVNLFQNELQILQALARLDGSVTAQRIADELDCENDSAFRSNIGPSQRLRLFGLVEYDGGFRITEKGRRCLP